MRAEIPAGTVVGPTSSRGDLVLRPDGAPAVPRTAAGGVLLPEAGPSLDRVLVGRRIAGEMPRADVGARVRGPVTGIVDYAYSNYRFWPLAPLALEAEGRGCDAAATLRGDRRHLTVASFNVENLSVAGPAERFTRIGEVIARKVGGPDVVTLEEVQDDSGPAGKGDGVVTSKKTLDALVAGIAAAGGPRYEAVWIDPVEGREGGQPGGNIRVALLLNPARVTLVKRGEAGPLDATRAGGAREEAPPHAQPRARRAPIDRLHADRGRGRPPVARGRAALPREAPLRRRESPVVEIRRRPRLRRDAAAAHADGLAPARPGARDPRLRRPPPRGRPEGPGGRPRRPERLRALGAGPAPRRRAAREPRPASSGGEPLHVQLRGGLAGPRPRRRLPRSRARRGHRDRPRRTPTAPTRSG